MAQRTLKKLQYDGSDVVVEVANRDGNGNVITSTYATKSELTTGLSGKQATLSEGDGIDISSNTISIEKTSSSNLGGMITGTGLSADSAGKVSLKIAGADQLGGIKAGTGLSIDSETGVATVTSAAWGGVTDKPFSSVASSDFSVTSNVLYVKDSKFATKEYVGDNFLGIGTTLPATNVIPSVSTANKVLLSTATGGTAAWSSGALSSSATKPLYLNSSGVLTAGNTYAGGTAVTLNGSGKGGSTASFYAPTGAGTSGQILVSAGSGAPAWSSFSTAGLLKTNASGVISVDTTAYITKSVSNLTNYYTKTEIDSSLSGIKQFTYETASSLPTASASTMYKIYIVPATNSATNNVKDEFITIRSGTEGSYTYSWEQIGSTVMDLSDYATKNYVDSNHIIKKYVVPANANLWALANGSGGEPCLFDLVNYGENIFYPFFGNRYILGTVITDSSDDTKVNFELESLSGALRIQGSAAKSTYLNVAFKNAYIDNYVTEKHAITVMDKGVTSTIASLYTTYGDKPFVYYNNGTPYICVIKQTTVNNETKYTYGALCPEAPISVFYTKGTPVNGDTYMFQTAHQAVLLRESVAENIYLAKTDYKITTTDVTLDY